MTKERFRIVDFVARLRLPLSIAATKIYTGIRYSCRMYDQKPAKVESKCHICAFRGGYFRCRRSKLLAAQERAAAQ